MGKHIRLIFVLWIIILSACNSTDLSENASSDGNNSTDEVVLRIMDWSDSVKDIREEFHEQFMEKYPHIQIEYTQLTVDQYKNTIMTAVSAGEAPDLFPIPGGMQLEALVEDGWYQSLEPYIDDEFKDLFVDGTFQNGRTMINDEIYSIPEAAPMPSSLIFFNKDLFELAGLDPEDPPETYSEFREYAKKITEAGDGKFYGMIEGGEQVNRWTEIIRDWSSLAGSGINAHSPVNLATEDMSYDTEPTLHVFQLIKDIAEDGSFHPNTMSISAPEARALFGQGNAGFIVQGPWSIGVWNEENPDLNYGVMAPPVPDSGRKGSIPITSSQPWIGLSAGSKHPEEAALYLKEFYGGDFFQKARTEKGDAYSIVKGINEEYLVVEQTNQYYDLVQEYGRQIPDPIIRKPEVAVVFNEFQDVSPTPGDILGGVVAGASEAEPLLATYSEQLETAWTNAINAAQTNGTDVSMEDFIFPNWNPMEDYTSEDYE
ncbi:ABC transporter substrate-binding protein [Gracilibacillus alcaliphilus]|uniref:ABC transporter substrate-binding protein n=1 Tax=Gracilibacillus alcaliphilus TaxID=1401441 RepID=UPI00195ECC50|nr:extracellular solute-binding protein [Gracilibacillus alcaliphilus]MBM7675651.1 multiple sugar transport system substrate-binding protein [Gracilibacillus alcaliphilus]